jgi:hypothetical protein
MTDRTLGTNAAEAAADIPEPSAEPVSLAVPPEVAARIEQLAVPFVDRLVGATLGSPAFSRAIGAVEGIGDREVQSTTRITAAFRDRPTRALRDLLDEDGSLTRNLGELRREAERLVREKGASATARRLTRSERRIRELVAALDADRSALELDNAVVGQMERALWGEIDGLREHAALAARLDALLEDRIERLRPPDPVRAHGLQMEALFAIRRRRRDLVMQLAVATQGYSALRLIEHDNLEVMWAIRSAVTTTATAIRTASIAVDRMASLDGSRADLLETDDAWTEVLRALDTVEDRKRVTLDVLATRSSAVVDDG